MVGDGTLLTVDEAVKRLRAHPYPVPMSANTVRRMADRGELPTMRLGPRRDRRLTRAGIDAYKLRKWAEAYGGQAPEMDEIRPSDFDTLRERINALVANGVLREEQAAAGRALIDSVEGKSQVDES